MLAFDVVDVFAASPYAGNQLAVVHGAAGLDDAQLLAITREFGYSETAFPEPLGPERYRVRIFTPGGELPFAGHPTLGTAWVLHRQGAIGGTATQECGAGDVGVRLGPEGVTLTATAHDLVGPLPVEVCDALLADLGLRPGDRAGDVWVAGAGLGFVHLPVHDDAVGRARVPQTPLSTYADAWSAARDPVDGLDLHAVTATGPDGLRVHARVFCPGDGVPEDPATGSSCAGLGMALAARGLLADGGAYVVAQGLELGRPSVLRGRVSVSDGRADVVEVSGEVHPVAQGRLHEPPRSPAGDR